MKLYFKGHDYKYAAEQMLLTLFPGQRPEYPASPPAAGEDALELSLFRGRVWATATARLSYRGKRCAAVRRCSSAELTGGLADSRALQRILKLAFYDAGVRALGREPPWGALTGVTTMDTDGTAADFCTIKYHIVSFGIYFTRIGSYHRPVQAL